MTRTSFYSATLVDLFARVDVIECPVCRYNASPRSRGVSMRRTCCWCWSYDVSGEEHTQKLMGDSSFDAGDYKPPRTKLAANVPQFEDFRLRKMVGKGSFGKVSTLHRALLLHACMKS